MLLVHCHSDLVGEKADSVGHYFTVDSVHRV